MDYTQLGRSSLSVSRLVLGTMNFGTETSEQDSHTIMSRAHEHGINFFDTADVYGEGRTDTLFTHDVVFGFGAHSSIDDTPELLRMVRTSSRYSKSPSPP